MTPARPLVLAALLALATVVLSGCDAAPTGPAGIELPPAGGIVDYQLGAAYEPDERVQIVARDRTEDPAAGRYSICYVNAFQTQPGAVGAWPAELLLRTDEGQPFIDPDWPDEVLVDTRTAQRRDAIAAVVVPWIEGCAASGFHAVEFDNLDTFTRTDGALALEDNLALAATLVQAAHDAGLAAGQKNAAEYTAELHEGAAFDFAVAEECAAHRECGAYTGVYGSAVIDIEYTDALPRSFARLCDDEESVSSMVLRDRDLVAPGDGDYAFAICER